MNRNIYKLKAEVAKALAHESRLIMLDALKMDDQCVCDLTALVGADQSTVSKHLSILKNAGIVSDHKEGNRVFYHLETPCVLQFFDCALEVVQIRTQATQSVL
ncbi:MAG: winged helix-turn-helix transcriptional regulator [Deltaproteobacteria bacterium]|nr:winged helix-turn-helix transcriptional regulator [Deltaproteobacteria bacterium]MBW2052647.1 winged helix-turn-helix transcriptional regulator [Deltaproteobacteria bacterium]MBW2140544.1 winged helix-turn-helix transcriptional regulator [Deltaproteobacteria bacterium]MBW2323044.1 winged helix-turn-helix transcriptional regulator [Deltaproteobacteria bacterium]